MYSIPIIKQNISVHFLFYSFITLLLVYSSVLTTYYYVLANIKFP